MNLKSILESLLFVWGEPLNINEISKILDLPVKNVAAALKEMAEQFSKDKDRGLIIQKFGNSYQITTKKENFEYIQSLMQTTVNKSLSTAAYKQPVTRVEIELIRGVKCSNVIKGLLDKGLIKETGKLDKPGRPVVYGTTEEFLRHFGLNSIDELPALNIELKEDKKAT